MNTRVKIQLIGLYAVRAILAIGLVLICVFEDKGKNGTLLFIAFLGSIYWIDDPTSEDEEEIETRQE